MNLESEMNPRTGEILAGCVSSLQRTGGIVTLILTDRIRVGLAATIKDERKLYELTNVQNIETTPECALYNSNEFLWRLGDEAAMHNISINVIVLPFNYENIGLP